MRIDSFSGKYRFLSNFYPCNIEFEGLTYPSTENAFQAAKTPDVVLRRQFLSVDAKKAKAMGKVLPLRPDWERIKNDVMLSLLRIKFASGSMRKLLLATGDAELIEGNWWHDQHWGVCNCAGNGTCTHKGGVGENMLGKLLMQVREELRNGKS